MGDQKYWALIKERMIVNIVVGDQEWADSVRGEYDGVIEVTKEAGQPARDWEQDERTQELRPPADNENRRR